MRLLRIAASLLALCLLQSCGGGGGGGGPGPDNSSFSITLDRTSISFEAFEGEFAPTQTLVATARGEYTGETLFVGATVEGQGIDPTIQITIVSDTTANIAVHAASGLAAGTYTGRVIFHACSDDVCANHVGGTPIAVSYTVTIKRGVRVTPTSLQLTSESGAGTSAGVTVELPEGQTFLTIAAPATQFDWLSVTDQAPTSFTVVAKSMPVGTYGATIQLTSGSSTVTLPVTYVVTAPPGGVHGIIADPPSLTFSTTEGVEVSQTLLVTPPTWNPALTATPTAPNGIPSDWLTVTPTAGGFTVVASAADLAQGSYAATILLDTVPQNFEAIHVPVQFTVGPGFVTPATTMIEIDSDTTVAQLAGRARIDIANGPPVTWTASATEPWLTLTRSAGLTGTDVEFTVDAASAGSWDNFSDHVATIHVTGDSQALTPIDFDVEVSLRLAEVTGVGPYLLISGQASQLIVRGRGFQGLDDPRARLRLESATPTSATRVNDTELAVEAGALALGTHTVRVTNALNRAVPTRTVKVIAAASYAYKAIPLNFNQVQAPFLYDAERQNAYVTQFLPENLIRFPVGSASTVAETVTTAGGRLIGLTADNASFVTGGQTSLALLDRDTLAIVPGTGFETIDTRNPTVYGQTPLGETGLMVSNDSRLWYTNYYWLHLDTKSTGRVEEVAPGLPSSVFASPQAMSRNGERLIGIDGSENPAFETYPLVAVDAADSVLRYRTQPVSIFPQIMVDDDGDRVLAGYTRVYDAQLQSVGDIVLPPSASAYDPLIAAISPDGTRVYLLTYLRSDYNQPAPSVDPRVYVFDSSTPAQTLPVLGYFEFDDHPGCLRSDCFSPTFANITPDGGALLFVGNRNFVVVPTDMALTSAANGLGNQKASGSTLRTVPWRK